MNRNKMKPAGNRDNDSMAGGTLRVANRSIKSSPAVSAPTGIRQSNLYDYNSTTTLKSKNMIGNDDDFVEQSSRRKFRKMGTDVKSPVSKTRPNYMPDPHDKSDFQNTYTSNKSLKKPTTSNIDKEFNRFDSRSLSNQKRSTPLSNARKSFGISIPLRSSTPLETEQIDLTNPPHLSATSTPQSNSLRLPMHSSTTSRPRKVSISIPSHSTLDSRRQSPPLSIPPRSSAGPRKRIDSLSISRHPISTSKELILPNRQKTFETPKPARQDVLKINKKLDHGEKSPGLFLPGKRRTTKATDNISTSSTSSITNSSGFVLPEKHLIKKAINPSFTSLPDVESVSVDDLKDTVECPYCHAKLDLSQSDVITTAYKDIKLKDDQYENQQLGEEFVSDYDRGSPLGLSSTFEYHTKRRIRRPVSIIEQLAFCRLHAVELVLKPDGRAHGWPTIIPFDTLSDRIDRIRKELDLVIAQHVESTYRDIAIHAYKTLGKNKARSPSAIMSRFQYILPGYYGTKGASIIQDILATMYLYPGKLEKDVTAPQLPIEYLQQVLVPEVGFRLIREDLILKNRCKHDDPEIDEIAKNVMIKSAHYGSCLQTLDWNDEDEDEDEDSHLLVDEGQLNWSQVLPVDEIQEADGNDDLLGEKEDDDWNDDNDDDCSHDDYADNGSQTIYEWVDDDDDTTIDEEEELIRQKLSDSSRINLQDDTTNDIIDNTPHNQPYTPADYTDEPSTLYCKDTVILLDDE